MQLALEWLATLSAAVFAGGALYISVVEHPARMKAGVTLAVAEFREMYRRAAFWQASAAAVSLVSGMLVAWMTGQWRWGLGGLLVGASIPFTLIVMMPTNRRLLGASPPGGDEAVMLLNQWGRLHWVRSILGTLGLVVMLASAFR